MNFTKMLRALIVALLVSALVYAVMIVVSDGPAVADALSGFRVGIVAALLVLSVIGYAARSLRWGWLMGLVDHPVSIRDALYIHISGQTMGISPGRVGEIFKPWLAREISGMPMSRGIALLFAERVADLIAMFILALGGLAAIGVGAWTFVVAFAAVVAGAVVASSEWFHRIALAFLRKQKWARRHESSASAISLTIKKALTWQTLVPSVLVSVLAWGLEGTGLYLVIRELGFDGLGLLGAISVYAVATIVGAFTFLPAGIGFTEASMAGILIAAGMTAAAASGATLITRVVMLWWAVLLGWLAVASRPALFHRLMRLDPQPESSEPSP